MPESRKITKIVNVTRSQFLQLQAGESVNGHIYDPTHYLYLIDDGLELPLEDGTFKLKVSNNGRTFDYITSPLIIEDYLTQNGKWEVQDHIQTKQDIKFTNMSMDTEYPGQFTLHGQETETNTTIDLDTGETTQEVLENDYEGLYKLPLIESTTKGRSAIGNIVVNEHYNTGFSTHSNVELSNWSFRSGSGKSRYTTSHGLSLHDDTIIITAEVSSGGQIPYGAPWSIGIPHQSGTLALVENIYLEANTSSSSDSIPYVEVASLTNGVLTLSTKYLRVNVTSEEE